MKLLVGQEPRRLESTDSYHFGERMPLSERDYELERELTLADEDMMARDR